MHVWLAALAQLGLGRARPSIGRPSGPALSGSHNPPAPRSWNALPQRCLSNNRRVAPEAMGTYREYNRADPCCLRSDVDPHVSKVRTQGRFHFCQHGLR